MTNSSQQLDLFNNSDDLVIINDNMNSVGTITLTSIDNSYSFVNSNVYATVDSITIDSLSNWDIPQEWINAFPDFNRIEDMCKKYPSLEIAFKNFKLIYELVKDDYDHPKDQG